MMPEDGFTGFAKFFKQRENAPSSSITTGIVIAPTPDVQIRLNEVVILDKENLVFAAHMIDAIKQGDEVIIMPVADGQLYFVIDKAVRLV